MKKEAQILLITANENETTALLNNKDFKYSVERSPDP